ncbi:hypothetical protein GCM10010172_49760 [Paractinoplanes ferrugineus]|uniref:Uncharacterized protein n=1 Tax=Paractinoplanes ferrugineus TaxID=113564 RepID=A0A919J9I1_9ACTN|nr:hypothetical protein [Actinoplanes ferrugineus]GIE15762.1 hypothetical protein Afe05nite_76020 [Actinoplanes ferrugineus]
MVTRRTLFGAAAAAATGAAVLGPVTTADAAGRTTFNGWRIDPATVAEHRIEGSTATVTVRTGAVAAVLLHVARRWHYEIAPLDTGEGGGVAAFTHETIVGANFETAYLSGTAIALHPHAYPLGGSEQLWPHQEAIVRDILEDLAGTVAWGGDLKPAKVGHFHLAVGPESEALAEVAARLTRARTAGAASRL